MYAMLCFDTEDIYFPPEAGIDDIPGWLAEIMTECEITGTFFVMGEKARTLEERGRTDVLEAMAKHDIASHQQGNRHPLLPEVVEGKGWRDGVEAVRAYEDWVTEGLVKAFGKEPVAFSRHNCYFAPQHVAVAGERGLPYMYMIDQLPGSMQPMWYAGALTFPLADGTSFGGFDTIYSRDDQFDKLFAKLDPFLEERLAEGREWVNVFACHPVQVMARGWFEHYALASGMSRTPEDVGCRYAVKPREEEARAKANFRRLCEYLRDHPDVEVVGISELARLFAAQPEAVTRDALTSYARSVVENGTVATHATFSPAELTCAVAESVLHWRDHSLLPETVERRDVLGPETRPVVGMERDLVTREELHGFCEQVVAAVVERTSLPANVTVGDERVGIAQFLHLVARAYLALAQRDEYARLHVTLMPRYPAMADSIDTWIRRNIGEHWAMPLDFSCDAMAEQARLQTWTVKPAWQSPPQGPPAMGMDYGPREQVR